MFKRSTICIAAVASAALVFVSSAAGATAIGNTCSATVASGNTLIQKSVGSASNPYVAPSSGVITSWGVNVNFAGSNPVRLLVVRATGAADTYTVMGVSDVGTYALGNNTFPTRISIQAGDAIGLGAAGGFTARCATAPVADEVNGYGSANQTPGATISSPSSSLTQTQVAVFASIEPDVDADGYGDESQDLCPQSAKFQTACPIVTLSTSARKRASFARVSFATNFDTTVTATGSVKVNRKTVKFKVVNVTAVAGKRASLDLKYPAALRKAIKKAKKSKKFKVKIKVTAKGIVADASKTLVVNVPGTKR